MTRPLIRLGPPSPEAWVRTKLFRAISSKGTRRNSTVYRIVKGLGSKSAREGGAVLEDAEGEAIGAVVIRKKILGVRNGGMQETRSPQIICTN